MNPARSLNLLLIIATILLLPGCDQSEANVGHKHDNDPPMAEDSTKPIRVNNWIYCWAEIPKHLFAQDETYGHRPSNIVPDDYTGARACKDCHTKNFVNWQSHAHAKMNAEATDENVLGAFDGTVLDLQGGQVTVLTRDGERFMQLKKGSAFREFRITKTIGSRHQQFYLGVLFQGDPIPMLSQEQRDDELVLPVGYRMLKKAWAPAYDVFGCIDYEEPELETGTDLYGNFPAVRYYTDCAKCHTTMPEGYRMLLDNHAAKIKKSPVHLSLWGFLNEALPKEIATTSRPKLNGPALEQLLASYENYYGPDNAVALGISCEACHLGCDSHVGSQGKVPPSFQPVSVHLTAPGRLTSSLGRTQQSINQACSHCHASDRLKFPDGAAHKNSAEYTDMMSGHCASQISCVHCHEPHTAIGEKWTATPAQDDARCIACHPQYKGEKAVAAHTHHELGSEGSRCMNCHMPKLTEGIEDVMRTHHISSPSSREVIIGGGFNACNACHIEKSVKWTAEHVNRWYDKSYAPRELAATYGDIELPFGAYWLKSAPREVFKLPAYGAMKRNKAAWMAPLAAADLDSPRLIVRQFAQDSIEAALEVSLEEQGYRYWLTKEERKPVMGKLKEYIEQKTTLDK